jgi:hypothetical protein
MIWSAHNACISEDTQGILTVIMWPTHRILTPSDAERGFLNSKNQVILKQVAEGFAPTKGILTIVIIGRLSVNNRLLWNRWTAFFELFGMQLLDLYQVCVQIR